MEVCISLGDGKVLCGSFLYLSRQEVLLDREVGNPYLNLVVTLDARRFRSFRYEVRKVYQHFIQNSVIVVEGHIAIRIQGKNLSKFVQKEWPTGKTKPFQNAQHLRLSFRYHGLEYSIIGFVQIRGEIFQRLLKFI